MKLFALTWPWQRVKFVRRVAGLVGFLCLASGVQAQQPFVTDNADVTEKGKVHLEIANEFDQLQPSSLPVEYQNTIRATLAYGLVKDLEISVGGQFLTLASRARPRFIGGIGDTLVAVKYNFRKERKNSRIPALTVSAFVQFPTGSSSRSLGSGITDYGINGIAQKTFREKNVFRVNGGYLFAGNTVNGVLGFALVKGQVFTGDASYVRKLGEKLQLGGEIAGAVTNNFQLSKGQFQAQIGGNYQINEKTTFDFGLIAGHFAASPRSGFQIGFSRDF
ncbi:MAG: hypothetical protein ABJA66_19140 [Actinomycetota bacterium]